MNQRDLKPASAYAVQYGVKMIGYGPPGSGKTPLANTAPRPVLMACEPGLLSMRESNVPTWPADTDKRIDEFIDWVFRSHETKNFDTIVIDSVSQMSEIVLKNELSRNRDGRKAYGEMARKILGHLTGLYYLQQKHVYLIGKQALAEEEGTPTKRPYFPGNELNIQVPHMYDIVGYIGKTQVPGMPTPQTAIRCNATFGIMARDRSGKLADIEPPDLAALFKKAMS